MRRVPCTKCAVGFILRKCNPAVGLIPMCIGLNHHHSRFSPANILAALSNWLIRFAHVVPNIGNSMNAKNQLCRSPTLLQGLYSLFTAALLPRCLSNFRAIRPLQHLISRLRYFTRFGGKTSYRLVNRGPTSEILLSPSGRSGGGHIGWSQQQLASSVSPLWYMKVVGPRHW